MSFGFACSLCTYANFLMVIMYVRMSWICLVESHKCEAMEGSRHQWNVLVGMMAPEMLQWLRADETLTPGTDAFDSLDISFEGDQRTCVMTVTTAMMVMTVTTATLTTTMATTTNWPTCLLPPPPPLLLKCCEKLPSTPWSVGAGALKVPACGKQSFAMPRGVESSCSPHPGAFISFALITWRVESSVLKACVLHTMGH